MMEATKPCPFGNSMNIVCIGLGNATLGHKQYGPDGKVVSETPAKWEPDPEGGCVAVWTMDAETKEITGPADVFGDWDAAGYLGRVLERIKPGRKINVPDLKKIFKSADDDGIDLCDYCKDGPCWCCDDCIVRQWKEGGG